MDSQENAEKIIKAKLKQLELQAQLYEEKVKKNSFFRFFYVSLRGGFFSHKVLLH